MSTAKKRIKVMHARHGLVAGQTCGECAHLLRQKFVGGTFWKCRQYGVTRWADTDWRVRWQACGQFEPAPEVESDRRTSAVERGHAPRSER